MISNDTKIRRYIQRYLLERGFYGHEQQHGIIQQMPRVTGADAIVPVDLLQLNTNGPPFQMGFIQDRFFTQAPTWPCS